MRDALLRRLGGSSAALALLALLAALAPAQHALAAGFAVLITPPRFELRAQPGEVLRQVLEITNASDATTRLAVQTAEWNFGEDGAVVFSNPLAEDSCRPWTALEARELELGPNGRRRFRFEVAVPADAATRECRFAITFEGEPDAVGPLALPVAGRIGIVVYVAVGDAQARLELREAVVVDSEGGKLPALTVVNAGNAHTRLGGFLSGRDESGQSLVFIPQSLPVLPGQTRTIVLQLQSPEGEAPPDIRFPIRLSGRLDWSGQRLDIDEVFTGE
jgi:fimbrial chaperone protein